MAPRKKPKANPKQNPKPLKSQIQILFERHTQKHRHKGGSEDFQNASTSLGGTSRFRGALNFGISNPENISSTGKNPTNLIQTMDCNSTLENTSNDDLLTFPVDADENTLSFTPEFPKPAPAKRSKFSPGMLVENSQKNDGSDQISWKFSPENARLSAKKAINPCSLKKGADRSWVPSSKFGLKMVDLVSENGIDGDLHDNNNNICNNPVSDQQSPFRTPPSLPNRSGKSMYAAACNKACNQSNLRLHKLNFDELLDEVPYDRIGDLILDDSKACSTSAEDNLCNKLTGNVNHATKVAEIHGTNVPLSDVVENINGSFTSHSFLVLEVSENSKSTDSSSSHCRSKVLRLFNEQSGDERVVHLWDEWVDSVVSPGDTVDVIGEFNDQGISSVDSEKNLLIVHPDMLISGTRVASSLSCPRRSVLDERLKSNEHSTAALLGSLLHQLFQAALMKDIATKEFLEEFASVILLKNVESLYASGVNENDMIKALVEAIPKILSWIIRFKGLQDSSTSTFDFGPDDIHEKFKISEVIDIEEMAWARKYGLKGMIDASLHVTVKSELGEIGDKIVPFELKTGKSTIGQSSLEHRAQVILYTLLMSERYLKNIDSGLLYYLHTDQTREISCGRSDLIGLIMRRNELASGILKASITQQLPPMSQCQSMCRGCRHLTSCAIYHKAHGGNAENSSLGDEFESHVSHLTTFHFAFLRHWDRLIDLEANVTQDVKKKIWHSHNSERNPLSNCVPSVVDPRYELTLEHPMRDKDQFIYRFHCQDLNCSNVEEKGTYSVDRSLQTGDYVILTAEFGHVPIANGIITEINNIDVSVSFSKHLRLPSSYGSSEAQGILQQIWRIDKDENLNSFALMRSNLVQLFVHDERSYRLRKMIIDLEVPKFDSCCLFTQDPAISYVRGEKHLNNDQRSTILKILTAKDYVLILGMPGTGKTSTMVHAVKALLKRGVSILLTSYTNSAVDNLLVKLKAQNVDFIRIGRKNAVHEEVMGQCISAMDIRNVEEIKLRMDQVKVVAVTCLGMTNPILSNRKFDVCIMDEAGQTTLPVSLGPLLYSSTFVLVGDHYQLPPYVQSTEAHESGMGKSLFGRLSDAHPQAISALQTQYRMCQRIMELSNVLIYDNRLHCGSVEVANAKLSFASSKFNSSWLKEVLNPDKPVVFINTDPLLAFEIKEKSTVNNPIEANIVAVLTKNMISHGIAEEDIGIITPYNSQINLMKQTLDLKSVEIHTIDKYQGRDKDCILISFVRSSRNPRNSTTLLGDWHRINVALTRAKKKLIMVGSCGTLSKVPLLKLLIENVESHSEIWNASKKDLCLDGPLKRCSRF